MNNARLGLWLFLASEAMLFGGLISAYVFLRTGSASGEFGSRLSEIPLAGFNTLVLLASSAAITFSVWSLRDKSFARHRLLLGATILLGTLFLGVKWLDYSHKLSHGLYPASSTYLAIYFTLTGVHALHVIGGIAVNSYLWITARRLWKKEPERLLSRLAAAALYWNFVDAVWLVLFLLLYVF
ncbi:heme-copper oxidase subunit III [bacterium]|nr:MAG: heme-copper oxidase subunit III [bacterium]